MFKETETGQLTLWVDVSTLLGWKGKYTGIPRTLSCLLEVWLTDERLRLRLCRFDDDDEVFREVSRQEVAALLTSNRNTPPWGHASTLRRKRKISPTRKALKKVYALLPWSLQEAGRNARRMVRHLIHFAQDMRSAVGRGIKQMVRQNRTAEHVPCQFAEGDVLLIAGAGWDENAFCETLWRQKRSNGVRLVALLYDFIPLKCPQFFPSYMPARFEAWARKLLWSADLILTISEHSRRDIASVAREWHCRLPAIEVLRLGDELPHEEAAIPPVGLPLRWRDRPFVLVAGTVEVRKNHHLLYHVWRRLLEKTDGEVPPLIFAGRAGWLTHELLQQIHRDPLLRRRIVHLPDVSDAELRWLYQHCLFTLYPSHYEGWGLPVAESLAHGKYCICSCASSLPEIAGNLIDYHDPLDALGCLRLVERALFEKGFLQDREARVREGFRTTRWVDCSASVLALMESHFQGTFLNGTRERPFAFMN